MNAYQRKAAGDLRMYAAIVGRIVSKLSRGFCDETEQLRTIIRQQEKQHRRLAPAGYRHTFPIESAVDYFMVQIFADAVKHPNASATELDGLREDYLRARLIVTRKHYDYNAKRDETALEMFARDCSGLVEMADKYDYTDLVRGAPQKREAAE